MVYVVIAVIILHILSLPLIVGFTVEADSFKDSGFVKIKLFFIPIFYKKIDTAEIKRKIGLDESHSYEFSENKEKEEEQRPSGAVKRFLIDFAVNTLMHIRIYAADLDAAIGTGDAATSAMTVGTVKIIYANLCAFFGFEGNNVSVVPEYDSVRLYFDFFGIFSISFADIIYALCAATFKSMRRSDVKRRNYANTVAE